jgi:RHS repeat-associated protein
VNIAATVGSRRAVVWQPAVRGDLHVTIRATNPVDCEGILFATSTTFYDVDSLGSPIAATDEAGAVLWRGEYTPFGAPLRNQSAAEIGFTGGRQDPVVGLVDLGHRQYQPEIGRFYGMDPIGMREDDPASFNRYAYGNNSPQRFVDPNGAIPLETLWDAANVMIGVGSFTYNVSEGNVGSAVIDAVGIVVDVAATIVPYVPGGLGTIIKATRTADAALDAATAVPQLGRMLDYLFGLATGAAHNIERSTTMMGQLNRIGLNDTPASRRLVTEHLTDVFNDPSTIRAVQDNGRVVRESLLSGPGGNLKMESIWEGDRLITMNLFGGR